MRMRLLVFIIIIFSFGGRKNITVKDDTDSILKIDLLSNTEAQVTKLSEIAERIEYIPLQTMESSLIGPFILKILNVEKRIYIENSGLDGEILCFDLDGKFLYKLQNRGRGPEEYTFISDFDVSSDNKFLTIMSGSSSKLLTYGISDTGFTFQRSITLKDPVPGKVSIVPETDKAFLAIAPFRGSEPTLSLLINTFGDTIHFKPNCYKYKMLRNKNYRALNEMLVFSIGNMVCFKEEFSDTVFFVDAEDNSFKPRMIFDTHGTLFTPEMRGNPEIPYDHTSFIVDIFETSRYVFYSYGSSETRKKSIPIENILYDKKTDRKYKLNAAIMYETIINNPVETYMNILKDDLFGGPDFNIRIDFWGRYCSGGKIFSFIEAIKLKKYVASDEFQNSTPKYPEKKKELEKLAASLKETDNPVLVLVRLKE